MAGQHLALCFPPKVKDSTRGGNEAFSWQLSSNVSVAVGQQYKAGGQKVTQFQFFVLARDCRQPSFRKYHIKSCFDFIIGLWGAFQILICLFLIKYY